MTTQLRFGSTDDTLLHAPDEEFLAAVKWRNSAPGMCRDLGKSPDLRTIGLCWKQQCPDVSAGSVGLPAQALRFTTLDRWVEQAPQDSLGELLATLRRRSRVSKVVTRKLDEWLTANSEQAESDAHSLLALCELLILHSDCLPAELTGRVWRLALAGAINQADRFDDAMHTEDWQELIATDTGDVWLSGGLLPWTCGLLFDEVKGAPRLAKSARAALNFQLLHTTDTDGSPAGDLLRNLRRALSGWADAALVAESFNRDLWRSATETRCTQTLERVASLLRVDGGAASTGDSSDENVAGLCLTIATLSGTDFRKRWAKLIQELGTPSATVDGKTSGPIRKRDNPSWQSDDAEAACLRTTWAADASLVSITHDEVAPSIELVLDGTPILRGAWGIEMEEDGDAFEFEAGWECVCFYTDRDVDYLELQFEFEGGPTIGRYVVLSRTRQFAVVSDILADSPAKRTDLISELPLATGVEVETVTGSREHQLKAGRQSARVLPLALPHDAGVGTSGRIGLDESDGRPTLTIGQATQSGGLFSPVLIDWSKERRKAPVEWRRLTVTEAGEVDESGALAYRCMIGDLHLVLFRALKSTDQYRTVLGYQPENETVIANFTKKGEFDEVVLVE